MNGSILTINAGSSSVKFASFDVASGQPPRRVVHGMVQGIGDAPRLNAWEHDGAALQATELPGEPDEHGHSDRAQEQAAALAAILAWLAQHPSQGRPLAVAHRVVHGGERFSAPAVVTPEVLAQLTSLEALAPLHQPHNLAAIRAVSSLQPDLPQIACFDTAFHAHQPWYMRAYALPQRLSRAGIRRYGFHGLSYEYIVQQLPLHLGAAARGKVVVAHLGNGASMCALRACMSVATTMGFTALDGLMMGTRCGQIDPGVVLHLLSQPRMSVAEVEAILYEQSGLLGVSGISADMRTLEASDHPDAKAAIDLFVSRITRELGGLAATLGGLDALVFTGGIGEHSAHVRRRVCRDAAWLGLQLDAAANDEGRSCISAPGSRVSAWVIPTNEEWMMASHAHGLLDAMAGPRWSEP